MNTIELTEKELKIAQLLLKYIKNHPDAKHSAEGIARWWILQQLFEEEIALIERVLSYLMQGGILQEANLNSDQKYYKINDERLKRFLGKLDKDLIQDEN